MNERAGYDAPDERAENLTHNDLGIGRLRCVREVPRKGAFEFFNRLNILSGTRLLDVACGAGQLTLPPRAKEFRSRGDRGSIGSRFTSMRAMLRICRSPARPSMS
jgi:hypothetical protein